MQVFFLLAIILQAYLASAFYSIGYYASAHQTNQVKLMNTGATFTNAPSAEQVADICSRLSGASPLLWEDKVNLPSAQYEMQSESPLILEVFGGVLPRSVTPVIQTTAFDAESVSPKLEEVIASLKAHGVSAEGKSMNAQGDKIMEVKSFLESQSRPVIVLHHETPANFHYMKRAMSSSNVTTLTEFQISQYQICMWTAIVMVLLIFSSVCAIVNMDVVPDSLLYAKFQSGRTEKRD